MNIEDTNILIINDADIEKNGCNSTWGFGNKLYVFAKSNPDRSIDKEIKNAPKIYEVKWDTELFQPIFCKLISESKVIFLNIQHYFNEGTKKFVEIKNKLSNHSREYRSVLKECSSELQSLNDDSETELLRNQKDQFEMFELLWSLIELLFIDTNPNSYIMKPLLEWFSMHFYEHDKLAEFIIRSQQREKHPQFWMSVKCLLLYGRVNDAGKLLSLHSNSESELYRRFIKLLDLMPIYNIKQQSYSEFCIKWHQWHDLTVSHLNDSIFSVDQNLQDMCKIICGDEEFFVECKDLLKTWYGMLVSLLFYQQPMLTSSDLHTHAKYCFNKFDDNSQFDNIILAIFSLDAQKAIHLSSCYFNNWWFVSHVTDLLTHLNVFPNTKLKFGSNLREFLLLEFSVSLLSHHSLWQHGIDYLSKCPIFGRDYIAEYLLRINHDSEFKVRKILRLCDLYEPEYGSIIKKEMAVKALKNNRLGNALMWSSKAKDIQLSNKIVERLFEEYMENGNFNDLDLLNNLGPVMHLSNHIAFLGKFCEYEQLLSKGDHNEAVVLLLVLLTEGNAPKKYWSILFSSLLKVCENTSIILEKAQICNLIDSLNKYQTWVSLKKMKTDGDLEKIQMLRIHLAQHLTTSIIAKKIITPAN